MEKTRSSVTLFKRILSLALAFVLLAAFAAGIPSPSITEEAREAHMNQGVEDEYAFLFE